MRLVVDGIIFRTKSRGGVARVFYNVLPRLCELEPKLRITVSDTKQLPIVLPKHTNITWDDFLATTKFQSETFADRLKHKIHYYQKLKMLRSKNNIWLSTYFTLPPTNWRGTQVVLVHDFIYELFPEHLPGGERVVRQKADAIHAADLIICNSQTTYRDLMKIFSTLDKQVFVTHLAADSTFRAKNKEEFGISLDFPFLLYIGKRNGYKNFKTLLDAYADWPGNTEVKLLLVGPNLTEAEINTFQSASVAEKIVVIEHPDDEALCDIYNQALAFVYPSIYEGFGIPLLEAMQCHCPIVASRIPSTLEVAGDVPLYFEATDKISLLDALNKLTDAADLQARAERGFKHARQYSWEKTASEFLKALQTLENWK